MKKGGYNIKQNFMVNLVKSKDFFDYREEKNPNLKEKECILMKLTKQVCRLQFWNDGKIKFTSISDYKSPVKMRTKQIRRVEDKTKLQIAQNNGQINQMHCLNANVSEPSFTDRSLSICNVILQ